MKTTTLLSDELRLKHAGDLTLGCGNFLHKAAALSPYASEPHFFMDRPTTLFTGESFQSFSLKEMQHAVDTYAAFYYGTGVRPKDLVAIYLSEGIENLIHFLALNAIGAIPAIVNGNMPPQTAALWMKKVGVMGLYSDSCHSKQISPFLRENHDLQFFVTEETASQIFRPELPKRYPFVHSDQDTVLIGHSSGTTGIPKAVAFGHQQFFYGIRYRLGLPFTSGQERMLSALPHSHSAGLAYLMLSVLSGCSSLILSSNQPENVLPQIEKFRPTMVVAFPETYVLMTESEMDHYDLSSIQLWFNGGDAAHETHIRKLISYGHHYRDGKRNPGSVFIDGLGSSEMGFSLFRHVHTPKSDGYDRCIGTPLEWVEAAVFNEEGEKLTPFQIGRLGVKSPSITPGYWNDSKLTAKSQVSGYFLTGDIFYYNEKGQYFHIDRTPDVIRTLTGNIYSLETEELLMKHFPEISDCSVVASPQRDGSSLASVIVRLKKGKVASEQDLLTAFNDTLHKRSKPTIHQVILADLKRFPLGPTGKVLKRELRDQLKKEATYAAH